MNKTTRNTTLLATATAGLLAQSASAAVIYTESIDGDLSDSAPNMLSTGLGSVLGDINNGSDFGDRAYFNGLTAGSTVRITLTTAAFTGTPLMLQVNTNSTGGVGGTTLLNETFNSSGGAVNFSEDHLVGASGEITFFMSFQEGGNVGSYDLTVDTVPEPSTSALTALAALAMLGRRQRK